MRGPTNVRIRRRCKGLCSAISRRGWRFCFGTLAARTEQHGEDNKVRSPRRVVSHAKERRDIQARVLRRLPRDGGPDDHAIRRSLAGFPNTRVCKGGELHFRADLEPFTGKNNREHNALGEADLAAAIAAGLLFEKEIGGPFDIVAKVLREEQPYFKCIRQRFVFIEKSLRFAFLQWRRRTLVMQDVANAEFVFDEDRRVERDFVPIRESITAFDAERALLGAPAEIFDRVLDSDAEATREAEFDFLGETVIRAIEMLRVALVNQSGVNRAGRQ